MRDSSERRQLSHDNVMQGIMPTKKNIIGTHTDIERDIYSRLSKLHAEIRELADKLYALNNHVMHESGKLSRLSRKIRKDDSA